MSEANTIAMQKPVIILDVTFHSLGIKRQVDTARDEIDIDTDRSMVAVTKDILDAKALRKIASLDGRIRQWLYKLALPARILKGGMYLVPVDLVSMIDGKLAEYDRERMGYVNAFLDEYPALIDEARGRLRTLFDAGDYPSAEIVRTAFRLDVRYLELNVPGSLATVSETLFNREKEKAERAWSEAASEVRDALRASLGGLTERLIARLSGPSAEGRRWVLREAVVSDMQEFLELFDARNITNDAELSALVEKAKQIVSGVDAATLRADDSLRATVKGGLEKLASNVNLLLSEKKKRAIAFDDE